MWWKLQLKAHWSPLLFFNLMQYKLSDSTAPFMFCQHPEPYQLSTLGTLLLFSSERTNKQSTADQCHSFSVPHRKVAQDALEEAPFVLGEGRCICSRTGASCTGWNITNTAVPTAVPVLQDFNINHLKYYITIRYHIAHHYFLRWNKVTSSSTSSLRAHRGLLPWTKAVLFQILSSIKNSHMDHTKVPAFNSGWKHTSKVAHTAE